MPDEKHPRVAGFRFAGIACGIKGGGRRDLGLIVADRPLPAAGVFTRNRVRAAPVQLCVERLARGRARAVLVNSGNANACTGQRGARAARDTTAALAALLGEDESLVLPASTGVIGVPLPSERIEEALPSLLEGLSPDGVGAFADAILTTDRWPKVASVQLSIGRRRTATVLGVAKGAGMIHPDMATTLAFVVTDAPASGAFLRRALRRATDETFNALTVDGDTSTNDTILALASGEVDAPALRGEGRDARKFGDALREVLGALGQSIVRDGEGAEKVVTLEVVGAPSDAAARKVARAIAGSLLVKTAIHGADPNWGRILAAAGTAGVAFDPDAVEIRIGPVVIARRGTAVGPAADRDAKRVMSRPAYPIRVELAAGTAKTRFLFCDIGTEYIHINASYRGRT